MERNLKGSTAHHLASKIKWSSIGLARNLVSKIKWSSIGLVRKLILPITLLRSKREESRVIRLSRGLKYHHGTSQGERTVWIVSFTGVSDEPRVLRQAKAMMEDGWRVVVLGYDGRSPRDPGWHFVSLSDSPTFDAAKVRFLWRRFRLTRRLCALPVGPGARKFLAKMQHGSIASWRVLTEYAHKFACTYPQLKPDLVISHDFHTCELGYAIASTYKCHFSVDCHEYARGQYMHDDDWKKYSRPYICGMHDYYFPKADLLTTVCDGIANCLEHEEKLHRKVQVVRSVPFYSEQKYRPVGEKIKILYHGNVSYIRGLHKLIKAFPLLRDEFVLTIRGDGDGEYIEDLRKLSHGLGLENKVMFEAPVPFDEIVPAANLSDIGYFVHKDTSPQKRFVLPNKYFEYIMAGLALCTNDLPEMARVTKEFDIGLLVNDYDENEIARELNQIERNSIERYKRNAIEAAKTLNWDWEKGRMLGAYNEIMASEPILS